MLKTWICSYVYVDHRPPSWIGNEWLAKFWNMFGNGKNEAVFDKVAVVRVEYSKLCFGFDFYLWGISNTFCMITSISPSLVCFYFNPARTSLAINCDYVLFSHLVVFDTCSLIASSLKVGVSFFAATLENRRACVDIFGLAECREKLFLLIHCIWQ